MGNFMGSVMGLMKCMALGAFLFASLPHALKWTAAQDDVGVTTYRLYRNEELVATTFKAYFLDMEYEREVFNRYFVTAVDAAGNESEASKIIDSPANGELGTE